MLRADADYGGRMNPHGVALYELAGRLARLVPSHRDPHRFHEDKSEIVHQMRQIARAIEVANDDWQAARAA